MVSVHLTAMINQPLQYLLNWFNIYMFQMRKAYALTLFMQHLVAIFAMYFFCKIKFNINTLCSCIAAIAYTSPMVIIINDNNSSWWINNYFEYRLCWGFIIPALPALFIYSDYFIENKSLKTSILSGMLLGFIVVISSFFIAFWPYILTMIGLYVLFLSKGKISSKFIFLLSLTFTSSIMQIDNISSAIDLYPISHRSRLDDNLNYFIQNNNIISAALILLKQVFVTFHFHVVLPVIGLVYFYFKSDYKNMKI